MAVEGVGKEPGGHFLRKAVAWESLGRWSQSIFAKTGGSGWEGMRSGRIASCSGVAFSFANEQPQGLSCSFESLPEFGEGAQQEEEFSDPFCECPLSAQQHAGLAIANAMKTATICLRNTTGRVTQLSDNSRKFSWEAFLSLGVPLAELAEFLVALVEEFVGFQGAEVIQML